MARFRADTGQYVRGAICMTGVVLSRGMTPDDFRVWYDRLGLKQAELAQRLDVDQPRISKWLRGEVKISGYLWRALEHLEAELTRERVPKRPKRRV